jgi:hypothetical protein
MYPVDNPYSPNLSQQDPAENEQLLKLMLMSSASKGAGQSGESDDRIQQLLATMAKQNSPQIGQSPARTGSQTGSGSSGVASNTVNNMMTALSVASKIYGGK